MANPEEPTATRAPSVVYRRDKKTKRSVLFADIAARYTIQVGGLMVIVAVLTIMLFLIYVCLPLLDSGSARVLSKYFRAASEQTQFASQMDEIQTIAVSAESTGRVNAFHVGTGVAITAPSFELGPAAAVAVGGTLRGDDVLFGFADGTVRAGKLTITSSFVTQDQLPKTLRKLSDRDSTDGAAIYSRIPGQYRRSQVNVTLDPVLQVADPGVAILHLDYRVGGTTERPVKTFVTLDANGTLRLSKADSTVNMMTGETSIEVANATIPLREPVNLVRKLLLNTQGDRVFVALSNGTLLRYSIRNFNQPVLAETVRVLPKATGLSFITYQNGENSLIVGGSDGSISIWFGVDRRSKATTDGIVLTQVHSDFEKHADAVSDVRVSQRTRLFVTTDVSGNIWIRHGTTERTLIKLPTLPTSKGIQSALFSPKDDALLAIGFDGNAVLWGLDVPHPETTLQSLFGRVWYEGYPEPDYVWQSTAGTDAPEPKLSLIPLIFGTFKAAFYSLMLAIPIALLGAIYTSEFLAPRTKNIVKPTMELMASIPSVVVGFVAALVLSPIIENWIAAIVVAFVFLPLVIISASFLWQLLPQEIATALDGFPKLVFYTLVVLGALWVAGSMGPWVEYAFFGGDFKRWSSGEGSGQPFLFLMLIPISLFISIYAAGLIFNAVTKGKRRHATRILAATRELTNWTLILALTLAIAFSVSMALSQLGYDIRGGFVDTYVQRNALVVAFALAFTQIPLIYSIAEDSLNAVPDYLRSASLACGASRWQTASWIIVPTAASGIFSAIMIGLGRAVGETMIVVMATGNTPIVEANIFNGLRTLSANINVELPEAVKDSTLYRTLFLCALVLFVITFVINTVAELVRQRYRKRAAQL